MSTTRVDFSDLGGQQVQPPPSRIDFSDLGGKEVQPATAPPADSGVLQGAWDRAKQIVGGQLKGWASGGQPQGVGNNLPVLTGETFNPFHPVDTAGYLVPQPVKDVYQDLKNRQYGQAAGDAATQGLSLLPGALQSLGMIGTPQAGVNADVPSALAKGAGMSPDAAQPGKVSAQSIEGANYSQAGDKLAASLRSNSAIDMPAEATKALPALKESFADLGYNTQAFQGRAGSLMFKNTVQHAIDLNENRVAQVLAPIRGDVVDAATLKSAPELAEASPQIAAKISSGDPITFDDIDAARKDLNKQLTRGNYYLKPASKQIAAPEEMIDAATAASQARSILYGAAQRATGIDVRPLQSVESSLIKLGDSANVTHNALSAKEAQFQSTPTLAKAGATVQSVLSARANPVSAFFSSETPGLTSPLNDFNRNMKGVFDGVTPAKADTAMNVTAPAQGFVQRPLNGLPPVRYEAGPTPTVGALPAQASPYNFGQTEIRGNPFIQPPPRALPPASSVQAGASPFGARLSMLDLARLLSGRR